MPHNRFFLDSPFYTQAEVILSGDEAHHLSRVMRKKEGEIIELVNGQNQLAEARLTEIRKNGVRLHLIDIKVKEPPAYALILCQAIPRLDRLETIVEKATELGMTELWLFPGSLSEKKELSDAQHCRMEKIAIAAMKQSGRLDLPKIIMKPPLNQWQPPAYRAYFGDLDQKAPPLLSVLSSKEDLMFFVGPEAGFSPTEVNQLRKMQVVGARIHTNILRTDTASMTALALISNYFLIKY